MDRHRELAGDGEQIFRSLVDHSLGLMCVHDLEGNLLFVNGAAAETLGFRPEDGIGWNLRRFLASAVESEFDAYLERIRTHGVDSGLMRLVSKDGTERVWLYRNVLHKESGSPARVLGHAQDVTERVRAEQALKESERRFRLLADTTPILIWMSDPSGSCTFLNQPWLDFTGRPMLEQLGEGWTLNIHPEERPRVVQAYWAAVTARGPFRAEYRLRHVDGEYRWVIGYGVPRIEEDGTFAGLVGSCVDVTEERRAREMVDTARARRIDSLGVLAGGIAHEFNNLLTAITGRIQLLLDRLALDEPACRDLHLIQRSAQRAAALTQQLLAFGRRQLLQPRLVDLNEFIRELSLPTVVGGRVEVTLDLDERLRRLHVDPGQLKRAVIHLIENACEAMPAGGHLVLETTNVDLDEAFVQTHPGAAVGPHVRITIRDSGAGLDEATQNRLFEPFFTAKRGVLGSGLSLPAVYGIIAQHGGYIAVESERNRGTAFTMYLPAVGIEGAAAARIASRGPEGPRGTETILLVACEREVCLLLRDILEPHGYRVLEALDPERARAIVAAGSEPVHLILTSVPMGASTISAGCPAGDAGAKILFLSGSVDDHPVPPDLSDRGVAVIQKPFTVLSLLTAVRQVLDEPMSNPPS